MLVDGTSGRKEKKEKKALRCLSDYTKRRGKSVDPQIIRCWMVKLCRVE
jgi:hypothetical protein